MVGVDVGSGEVVNDKDGSRVGIKVGERLRRDVPVSLLSTLLDTVTPMTTDTVDRAMASERNTR